MKFIRNKKILTAVCAMLVTGGAIAQFATGPRIGNAVLVPAGGYVVRYDGTETNLASPLPFTLTANQLKFYLDWGCTNATTGTSNWTFNFQISADGSKWLDNGVNEADRDVTGLPVLSVTLPGPGGGAQTYTNLFDAAEISGYRYIRLFSVSNQIPAAAGSTNTLYLTNVWFSQF